MTKNKPSHVSAFGDAALALDRDFLEKERLARELERLANPSDKGMDRTQTLLNEVEACRGRMAVHMQRMVQTLEEARLRNEAAEKVIAERAAQFQERQREAEKLLERFHALAGMVREITTANLQFQHLKGSKISPEDRAALTSHIPQITEQLGVLVAEAQKLMEDSRKAHLKVLERNTDSLRQSLQSLRQRLGLLADSPIPRGLSLAPPEESFQDGV